MNLQHLTDSFLRAQGETPFWLACGALLSIASTIIIIRLIHGAWLVAWDARKSAEQGE